MKTVTTQALTPNQQLALDHLRQRRQAYLQTFNLDDRFASFVLADLAAFCRANESTFHENDRVSAVMEGRREVWLRIIETLQLDEMELLSIKMKR